MKSLVYIVSVLVVIGGLVGCQTTGEKAKFTASPAKQEFVVGGIGSENAIRIPFTNTGIVRYTFRASAPVMFEIKRKGKIIIKRESLDSGVGEFSIASIDKSPDYYDFVFYSAGSPASGEIEVTQK